jgi:hypothetical protein
MKSTKSILVRPRLNPRGWAAGPFRAAPEFTPSTMETRGSAGRFVPQKGPCFDVILSSASEFQRSSHALFAQH